MTKMSRTALPALLFVVLNISAAAVAGQNLNLQDLEFTGITPCRLIDTRNGQGASSSDDGPVGARSSPGPYDIAVRTFCGVPLGAQAVVLNLTVVAPTQAGDLRIGPTDANPFPVVSTVNYPAGVGALANGCDMRSCDTNCGNFAADNHPGWLADAHDAFEVFTASELGGASHDPPCQTNPVWCCSLN